MATGKAEYNGIDITVEFLSTNNSGSGGTGNQSPLLNGASSQIAYDLTPGETQTIKVTFSETLDNTDIEVIFDPNFSSGERSTISVPGTFSHPTSSEVIGDGVIGADYIWNPSGGSPANHNYSTDSTGGFCKYFIGEGHTEIIYTAFQQFNGDNTSNPNGFVIDFYAISPCDTDGDGIFDKFDLDSDGDGCPDAVEGGGSFTDDDLEDSASIPGGNVDIGDSMYSGTAIDGVIRNLKGGINSGTGIPTSAGSGQSVGASQTTGTAVNEATFTGNEVCEGDIPTFNVTPISDPTTTTLNYEWEVSTNNGVTYTSVASSTGTTTSGVAASLTLPSAVTLADDGTKYKVIFTPTDNACPKEFTVDLAVTAKPEAGNLLGEQTICVDGTTVFTSDSDEDGAWSSANMSIATVNSNTGEITGVAAGTTTITYTVLATSPCTVSDTATRTVTVLAKPEAGTLDAGDEELCVGETITVGATGGDMGGEWSVSNGNAQIDTASGELTALSAGTVTVSYEVEATSPCVGSSIATVLLTITEPVSAGTSSGDIEVCKPATVSEQDLLDNLTGETSNGAWTDSANMAVTFPISTSGDYTYTVVGTGGCTGMDDAVTVTVTFADTPTADAGDATASICEGSMYTPGSTASNGTVQWETTGTGIFNNDTLATPTYTPSDLDISAGEVTLTMSVTGTGGCSDTTVSDTVVLTITGPVSAGTSSGDIEVCSTDTVSEQDLLDNLTGESSGGSWTDAANMAVTFPISTSGDYTYTVLGTGGCTGMDDTAVVTVTFTEAPNAGTLDAGDAALCTGEMLTIMATGGDTGGEWSVSNGNASIDTVTGEVTALSAGTVTVSYEVDARGSCGTASIATVELTITTAVSAGTSTGAIELCSTETVSEQDLLDNLTGESSGGSWTDAANMAVTFPISISGDYTYTVLGTDGCLGMDDTATVTVTFTEEPTVDAGDSTAAICEGMTYSPMSTASNGTVQWQTSGTGIFNDTTSATPTYTPSDLDISVGNIILTISVSGTGTCSGTTVSDSVSLSISDSVSGGTSSGAIEVCSTETVSEQDLLENLTGETSGGTWTDAASMAVTFPISTSGDYTYTVVGAGACLGMDDTAVVTVTFTEAPNAGTLDAGDATLCVGESVTIMATGGDTGGTWSVSNGNVSIDTVTGEVTALSAGTVTVSYMVEAAGSCSTDATSTVVLTITEPVSAGVSSGAIELCSTETVSEQDLLDNLTGETSGGTWTDAANMAVTFPISTSGDYTYSVDGTDGCLGMDDTAVVTVTFTEAPNAGTLDAGDATLCVGESEAIMATGGDTGGTWSVSNGNASIDTVTGEVTALSAGTVTVLYEVEGSDPCATDVTSTVVLTITEPVSAGVSSGAIELCSTETVSEQDLFDNLTGETSGGTWTDAANMVVAFPISTSGDYTYSVVGTGGCTGMDDTAVVTVTFTEAPNAGTLDAGDATLCVGESVTIMATGGDTGGTWSVSNGNASIDTVTGEVTALSAGTVTVLNEVEGSDPCATDVTSTVEITIYDLPVAEAGMASEDLCPGVTITLDGTGSSVSDVTYSWATTDGVIDSGFTTLNPVVSSSGTYTLTVINTISNCSSTDVVTVTDAIATDTDGDGLTDCEETTGIDDPSTPTEATGVTDPNNPCDGGDMPDTSNPVWQAADCDGDGETNGFEAANGTDPNDPCSVTTASIPTNPGMPGTAAQAAYDIWAAADCDGDGETNGFEAANGTDPNDPCSVTTASIPVDPMSPDTAEQAAYDVWVSADCDGDGETNGFEAANGTDPFDPCSNGGTGTVDMTNPIWQAADCDGDGETNGFEISNGTDPNDPCNVTTASIPVDPMSPDTAEQAAYDIWASADCDGDGETNGFEAANGTDPFDPCSNGGTGTVDITNPVWQAADCDGDGETNGVEEANGTDPNDPCSVTIASIPPNPGMAGTAAQAAYDIWAAADCDGDGETNGFEAANGTNPNDPCSVTTASIPVDPMSPDTAEQAAYDIWASADCDGDGETNGFEAANGTDPFDPCSNGGTGTVDITNPVWQAADCDGDGETNGVEEANGTDPNDPCSVTIASIPTNPGMPGTAAQAAYDIWAAADCDGDGETNGFEAANGTDPNDPCSVTTASIPVDPMSPDTAEQAAYDVWASADCDGDGVTNGQEVIDNTDPFDPCVYNPANQDVSEVSSEWEALDCDGDGVTNGYELIDGTGPLDPCEFMIENATVPQTPEWEALDCDGDGVTNGDELADGTDPFDPCDFESTSQTIGTSGAWMMADCDGDGVTNGQEVLDNTDPTDPCAYNPASQDVSEVSSEWEALDCDGDGVTNGYELIDGTNPLDPCEFMIENAELPQTPEWEALDCDGDGVSNGDELLDGTNPSDPCDYLIVSQELPTSGAWMMADCDGDGVTNGQEILDGSDPSDPCDFDPDNQSLTPSQAWLDADCDRDGVSNGTEILEGTNPQDPCSLELESQDPDADISEWEALDCDGDGVTNGQEIIDGTDLMSPCDYIITSQTMPTSGAFDLADCDGNGTPNGSEITIYDIMTPNGDGLNDVLVISGLENFPRNKVTIYNRWGVEVFRTEAYGQNDNYFRGISEGRTTISEDDKLPVGTYYYVVEYFNASNDLIKKAGPLYINR